MRINSLIFFLNSKYEEEKKQEVKETYLINLVTSITRNVTGSKNIKSWSEIEERFNNNKRDKRSAKEIEEDVLNKFKKLG